MNGAPLDIPGAFVLSGERFDDERGFFARLWSRDELVALGLVTEIAQCSLSHNARKGTLRGLHVQRAPHEEVKIVTCLRGELFDVVADVRRGSPTFGRWVGVQLEARTPRSVYVPAGCAHGFLTTADDTLVHYMISHRFAPECAAGLAWDDPRLGIRWPAAPTIISEKDRHNLPLAAFERPLE